MPERRNDSKRRGARAPAPTRDALRTRSRGKGRAGEHPAEAQRDAIADVLRVMASSPQELVPLLQTVIEHAVRLCGADWGFVDQVEGQFQRRMAVSSGAPERERSVVGDGATISQWNFGRAILEKRPVVNDDFESDPEIDNAPDWFQTFRARHRAGDLRQVLGVPLLSGDAAIGVMGLWRKGARPFTAQEIDLVRTFADQSVVAIESARQALDTKEALERQTATAEILRVIAASPTDVQPVLDAIASNARRFCGAEDASVAIVHGTTMTADAHDGPLPTRTGVVPVDRTSVTGRSVVDGRTVQVIDWASAAEEFPLGAQDARELGEGTNMATPLLRKGEAIGAILLRRLDVAPFTDQQAELLRIFADQAVIAIENVRLFNETKVKSGQLEVANHELAAASRHKSEFLANMSHELRTPLNAVIGFSDVLEQRMFGDLNERQAEYVKDIAGSGRHLLELVNEILDLSKVEAGRMELEPSEFALADTIRGALLFVRERASRHGIELAADVSDDLGTIVADERKVRQVLLNLLSNAVKFTPDGGTIGVKAWRNDREIQISVRDTGIGISPEDQPKVFEEFRQVGKASDRSREGTGLGLTLAKKFVELHGGKIWVESQIGKGTTFTFAIPVDRNEAAPA